MLILTDGASDGNSLGELLRVSDGACETDALGWELVDTLGSADGTSVGWLLRISDGACEGHALG